MVQESKTAYKRSIWRPWRWPWAIACKYSAPIPPGLRIVNFIVQRFLRINSQVPWSVHFTSIVKGKVKIGKSVETSFAVSSCCYIQGINGVEIGDGTIFASGVKIISANHEFGSLHKSVPEKPIVIGKKVWLGANSVILPGVKIGDGAVIAAGAIVTKDVEESVVVGGNPARVLKRLPV